MAAHGADKLACVLADSAENPIGEVAAIEAGMKGAAVVWVSPDPSGDGSDPPHTGPVWHVWSDGACYLLTGPGEQPLPGLRAGGRCAVTVRNSSGGRALTWSASIEVLDPGGPEWSSVAPKLAAGRLNGGDPVSVVPTWPGRLSILCLRPSGGLATAGLGMPTDSQAAAPLPSPARTPYRMPSDITRGWRRRRAGKRRT